MREQTGRHDRPHLPQAANSPLRARASSTPPFPSPPPMPPAGRRATRRRRAIAREQTLPRHHRRRRPHRRSRRNAGCGSRTHGWTSAMSGIIRRDRRQQQAVKRHRRHDRLRHAPRCSKPLPAKKCPSDGDQPVIVAIGLERETRQTRRAARGRRGRTSRPPALGVLDHSRKSWKRKRRTSGAAWSYASGGCPGSGRCRPRPHARLQGSSVATAMVPGEGEVVGLWRPPVLPDDCWIQNTVKCRVAQGSAQTGMRRRDCEI